MCEAQSSTEHCPHGLARLATPSRPIGIRCRQEVAPMFVRLMRSLVGLSVRFRRGGLIFERDSVNAVASGWRGRKR